jgi:hypothetical protein
MPHKDPVKRAEYNKLYDQKNSKTRSLYKYTKQLKKYGITPEDYDNMYNKQNGCCKICKIHQSDLKIRLCVDHCHETGKVRGLLCKHCNTVLGMAKDNIDILEEAKQYLINNKEN